jgi:hypothetical protein
MNKFTKKSQFLEDAQFILDNCSLLIPEDCKIINGVLYERLGHSTMGNEPHGYRFFFSTDDYDYVEDCDMLDMLDEAFSK